MTELSATELAKVSYQAYGDYVDWKNYMGKPMPKWEELPEKIRGAWEAGTQAVRDALGHGSE